MKVQILVGDRVVATQLVSLETLATKPSLEEVKRIALKACLQEGTIRISESLRTTFKLFEVNGDRVDEDRWPWPHRTSGPSDS
jgi:hypothetical protein